jgi:predicted NBD/HSP70 family sugar kinase
VAADRLGVLHDVVASVHAARAHGLDVAAIALSTPVVVDASTGTNATELSARAAVRGLDVVALPRRSREELATVRELDTLAAALARGATADARADRR